MPEGPEIRRAADRLQRAIVDQPLRGVWFAFERLKSYETELGQSRVAAIETRGKALLTHFDCGLAVYSHNQLYGRWSVVKPGVVPKTNRTLRFAVYGERADILLFSASDIEVLDHDGIALHPFLTRLGPDLLNAAVDIDAAEAQIRQPRFARKRLADLLLDQGFLAGVGNYLRSEILHEAGLAPTLRIKDLNASECHRLAESALTITRRSYQHAGLTQDLSLAARLKAAGLSFERRRFAVFAREGQPCYRCAAPILRADRNRRIYWCPGCQPELSGAV